ncbi:hypothetical protein [Paraglaciecola psychrophila]|jgi:hypothetical protein|uniref:Lipoprotein n=1 Tax=Paraglaciecola psychrophila 170 TaxID=1129794 RepID=K6Z2X5_9ALTE|nr:hypothetical protein [Paraglaciecola psychrophila]AGH47214.1 hypothetical protein C427_5115 [Paraglaciecola psychrophila 170]GAC39404.1 hypothetical protein GPSY_3793 [Paraglaciecola psychrophila 170]
MKRFSILLIAMLFIGCQTVPKMPISHKTLLYDQGFVGFGSVNVES